MSKPATHIGQCQGCGHTQKLPGGNLSLHGYTVEWGFFSGTCDGARELPYELSCDYCKKCIVSAKASQDAAREQAKHFRRTITEPVADYVDINLGYDRSIGKRRTKTLSNVTITKEEVQHAHYTEIKLLVSYQDGEETKVVNLRDRDQVFGYESEITEPLQAARALNLQQAHGQDIRIEHLQSYINWQQKRVNEWKLQELRPVPDETKTVSKGDNLLLKALAKEEKPMKIGYFSSNYRFTRNGRYTQALKLETLGLVEITERDTNCNRPWLVAKITEAGRAVLAQEA